MKIKNQTISISTNKEFDIIDITDRIKEIIQQSEIQNGLINIQTLHTTATFLLNEKEPLLLQDIKNHLVKLSPKDLDYNHDDFTRRTVNMCNDECANGYAHCRAIHFPVNICLNVVSGQLQLGQWQRIMFIELDRARKRNIQAQVMGE